MNAFGMLANLSGCCSKIRDNSQNTSTNNKSTLQTASKLIKRWCDRVNYGKRSDLLIALFMKDRTDFDRVSISTLDVIFILIN
uniref:TFIIS N-terminal domain-containing protein n=1 Tax=Panagrellus redivivus TaxID=6233 RepID=A0A7E4W6P1_PANRE